MKEQDNVMLVVNNGLPLKEIHDMFHKVYLNDNLLLTPCIYFK